MVSTTEVTANQQASAAKRLQLITIGWMIVELAVASYAGIRARSTALTAFGLDSGIELISAIVVLRRFLVGPETERRAAQISGTLLYLLAAYILLTSLISIAIPRIQPQPSAAGIVLLIAAAVIMPVLGRAKKTLAAQTSSRALSADAAQSNICAYMSWIALAGLAINYLYHLPWADSLAALLLLPLVLREAAEARRGEACGHC